MKGHPHAGHMEDSNLTIKVCPLLKVLDRDNEKLMVVKGSLPGARNSKLKFFVE